MQIKPGPIAGIIVFVGVAAIVLVIYFGVQLYRSIPSASEVTGFVSEVAEGLPTVPEAIEGVDTMLPFAGEETASEGVPTTLPGTEAAPAADWLTPPQRALLATFGIDESALPATLSPELEACFVDAIGRERVDAIKAGETPTFVEGAKAVGCL